MCAFCVPAWSQPKGKSDKGSPTKTDAKVDAKTDAKPDAKPGDAKLGDAKDKKKDRVQNFDFNAMNLNGSSRTPQLLYFLERANEELERAFLERRSFIPHMVRSIDEEAL